MPFKLYAYYLLLLLVNILFFIRRRQLSFSERLVSALMVLTFAAESTALYTSIHQRNAFLVYHFFNPIQFFFISLYFNQAVILFRKYHIGWITGLLGILLSILNTRYLQPLGAANSYFLLFEGTVIILYCLVALRQILLEEEHLPYSYSLFWFTVCFLIYWSLTFTEWGFLAVMDKKDDAVYAIFNFLLGTANFTFYIGIALILCCYHKLTPQDRA